jgi:cell division protein FtsB
MKWLTLLLLVILLALQYRLWVGEGSFAHLAQLKQQIKEQQQENTQLALENAALAAQVKALKDGYAAIEERAREELGLVKEGETFFLLVEKEEPNSNTTQ